MSYKPVEIKEFLNTPISLAKLNLVVVELPQIKPFRSAIGIRNSRKALIVKWHTNDGVMANVRADQIHSILMNLLMDPFK